ncbi:hypothetical protein IGI04_016558 [Brassica rapa subsp. trilocularis]|uniref:Uncharacterized protein n=1 Tax=Brassica rapa subsp. trilocularis TaxID=1813537 RepID=A0ABQ7MVS1_BRACM|nr:hypothetical protein IGI04_016558 [Brassica rapa subsp. trilocularis]
MNRKGIRTTEGLVGSMGKRGGRSVQKRQVKNRGAGQAAPQERSKKGEVTSRFSFRIERTISGNVDGKEGNAPETHGTRNGTHGDVGKVDMCVLNPAPWNPGWKWGGTGVSYTMMSRTN